MILEALRLALALLLLVALPGWLLLRALFPRRELSFSLQLYLTLGGGVLVLMLVGIVLGFLPHAGGRGAFQSLAMGGMPNVELGMLAACLALFWFGAHRGAHPRVTARFPRFATPWSSKAPHEQP
jgi:hypothetical protein